MRQAVDVVPAATARRLLMAGAGLLDDPTRRVTAAGVDRLVERLGFVQVDSINVVERAHHHIVWTRAHAYRPALLKRLHEQDRTLFEHWTHDASLIPVKWFPHWRPRFRRAFESKWWRERLGADWEKTAAVVLERVQREGPLLSRDFECDGNGRSGGWWEWKPAKAALEYLWRTGKLAVARREGFQKVYDLMERVVPAHVHEAPAPSPEEHAEWACRTAMERLGVATAREVAGFWNAVGVQEAAAWCAAAVERGELVRVEVGREDEGKAVRAFALADWRERADRLADAPEGMRLLSPFDPVLRDRKRALRLFGFEYRFEAFTPAAKRRHGYYVLPVLEGERLVARLDPRLDRARGVLEVLRVWWEPGVRPTRARKDRLEEALEAYAQFAGADRWEIHGGMRSGGAGYARG